MLQVTWDIKKCQNATQTVVFDYHKSGNWVWQGSTSVSKVAPLAGSTLSTQISFGCVQTIGTNEIFISCFRWELLHDHFFESNIPYHISACYLTKFDNNIYSHWLHGTLMNRFRCQPFHLLTVEKWKISLCPRILFTTPCRKSTHFWLVRK